MRIKYKEKPWEKYSVANNYHNGVRNFPNTNDIKIVGLCVTHPAQACTTGNSAQNELKGYKNITVDYRS